MTNEIAQRYLREIAARRPGMLEEFTAAISGRIFFIAKSVLKDDFTAEDVLSVIIERVWTNAETLAALKRPLGYINTSAYNAAIDLLRKRRETELDDDVSSDCFEAASATKADILSALEKLENEERTILLYVAVAGYSLRECARLTGMTKKMCFTRYNRAKEKFGKFYGEAET